MRIIPILLLSAIYVFFCMTVKKEGKHSIDGVFAVSAVITVVWLLGYWLASV